MNFVASLMCLAALVGCGENGTPAPEPTPNEWDNTKVEYYEYSNTVVPSTFYHVEVNGKGVTTLPTTEAHVCVFGSDGVVEVEIFDLRQNIESVVVRPISKNYT